MRTPFPLRGNEEEARHMAWQAKPGHILALETQTLGELTGRLTEFYPDGTWVRLFSTKTVRPHPPAQWFWLGAGHGAVS